MSAELAPCELAEPVLAPKAQSVLRSQIQSAVWNKLKLQPPPKKNVIKITLMKEIDGDCERTTIRLVYGKTPQKGLVNKIRKLS